MGTHPSVVPLLEEVRRQSLDNGFTEKELFLSDQLAKPKSRGEEEVKDYSVVLSLPEGISSLTNLLKTAQSMKAEVEHVETRKSKDGLDALLKLRVPAECTVPLVQTLKASTESKDLSVYAEKLVPIKDVWYPRHISDLDNCSHLMTHFEPDLDQSHPGWSDKSYRARRKVIADMAFSYKHGQPIPTVKYTDQEIQTWGHVFKQLLSLHKTHTCSKYNEIFTVLQKECGFNDYSIPQLQDVSEFLQRKTGFRLRPVAGLLTARDFLASLAFRVFQCTQYVRHESEPEHSVEPDCIHELIGHIPMLADPEFAQFSHELGLASLCATDEEIEKFATLYWFTVEFGLCREGGKTKAYGAGLLSSFGELKHSLSEKPEHRKFEPSETAVQPYQDQHYQDVYYVVDSIADVQDKLRSWTKQYLKRPCDVHYDPFTQTITMLDSMDKLQPIIRNVKADMNKLGNAISCLHLRK